MAPTITNLRPGARIWVAWVDSETNCRAEQVRVQEAYQTERGTYVVDVIDRATDERFQMVQVQPTDDVFSLAAVNEHDGPKAHRVIDDDTDYEARPVFAIDWEPGALLWQIFIHGLEMGYPTAIVMDMIALEIGLYPAEAYTMLRAGSEEDIRVTVNQFLEQLLADFDRWHWTGLP